MSQGNDLTPPIDTTVEYEPIGFDFGPILDAGVTIVSIISVTCQVVSGTDPSPASRLTGPATIIASKATGAANAAVSQPIGNMLAWVRYRLQCVVQTSDPTYKRS